MDSRIKIMNINEPSFHGFDTSEHKSDSPLAATTFYRSKLERNGYFEMVHKCDNYHLLMPEMHKDQIQEFMTGKYAQVVVGTEMTRIVFEDFNTAPMTLEMSNHQICGGFSDMQDKPQKKGFLAIYMLSKRCPGQMADEVVEVGRMDLWINRSFEACPFKIRTIPTEDQKHYKKNVKKPF